MTLKYFAGSGVVSYSVLVSNHISYFIGDRLLVSHHALWLLELKCNPVLQRILRSWVFHEETRRSYYLVYTGRKLDFWMYLERLWKSWYYWKWRGVIVRTSYMWNLVTSFGPWFRRFSVSDTGGTCVAPCHNISLELSSLNVWSNSVEKDWICIRHRSPGSTRKAYSNIWVQVRETRWWLQTGFWWPEVTWADQIN